MEIVEFHALGKKVSAVGVDRSSNRRLSSSQAPKHIPKFYQQNSHDICLEEFQISWGTLFEAMLLVADEIAAAEYNLVNITRFSKILDCKDKIDIALKFLISPVNSFLWMAFRASRNHLQIIHYLLNKWVRSNIRRFAQCFTIAGVIDSQSLFSWHHHKVWMHHHFLHSNKR